MSEQYSLMRDHEEAHARLRRCPACGLPNACARAANRAATDCWCRSVAVPSDVLAQLREKYPPDACLCRDCLERTIEGRITE